MRNAFVITLALTASLITTACQSKHHQGAAKAKTKVQMAKIEKNPKKQAKNVNDIEDAIQKESKELESLGFTGLKDEYSIQGAKSFFTGVKSQNVDRIKQILGDVKGEAEAMIEAGKDLKGAEGDKVTARGEVLKFRAVQGIEKMNKQIKTDKESAESAQYY